MCKAKDTPTSGRIFNIYNEALIRTHPIDIVTNQICGSVLTNRGINAQFVAVRVSPFLTGNTFIIGSPGIVRANDAFSRSVWAVSVHFHYFICTVILGGIDKDAHYILIIP